MEYKICTKCNIEKPLSEFWKKRKTKDGFQTMCKDCIRENKRVYRNVPENKIKINISTSIYKKSDKYKEYVKKYNKEYRAKNALKIKQQNNKYWKFNRKVLIEKTKLRRLTSERIELEKKYRQSDIGKAVKNNYKHRRRAKEKITDITNIWLGDLKKNSDFCLLCNCKMNVIKYHPQSKHLDHIIPLNIGGTHTMDNVRYICRKCNLSRPKDGSDIIKVQKESL